MRVAFAGTPRAARGRRSAVSPVAERAEQAGVEVLKPIKPRDPEFLDRLQAIGPDCCPVTGYGALLPQVALDIPADGWVNLHFSLLPAWRGAAPVQHALLHGDDITGATTFRIVKELDAGPVFGVVPEPIRPTDTAGDLLGRIAVSGAELLVATLDGIESGQLRAEPQPSDGVSFAPKIGVDDARVNWSLPAAVVDRLIRACTPAPGAWTVLDGARLKLGPVTLPRQGDGPELDPGELLANRDAVLVGTGTSPVRLGEVQPAGKRRMTAGEWARGLRLDPREPHPAAAGGTGQRPRP